MSQLSLGLPNYTLAEHGTAATIVVAVLPSCQIGLNFMGKALTPCMLFGEQAYSNRQQRRRLGQVDN